MKKDSKVFRLVLLSIFVAMEIVLSRFLSFSTWNTKIGFAFLPVAAAAILMGPLQAAVVGGVADVLGAILVPIGAYFPGFTVTAALTGVVFGLFFHKEQTVPRVLGAVLINQFILGLLINSYWISVLYGRYYRELLVTRFTQSVILTVVQTAGILALAKLLKRIRPSIPAEVR